MTDERTKEKVKVFLNNGFKYEGFIILDNDGFITLEDRYGKIFKISKPSIAVMEVLNDI